MKVFKNKGFVILMAVMMLLTSCSTASSEISQSSVESPLSETGELVLDHAEEMIYAKEFSIDYFKGGYKLIKISNGDEFLTIPEGATVPSGLKENTVILQMPITNMLISSAPTMSLINSIGALDRVSQTTSEVKTWYIPEVAAAMENGQITYVGEYKDPDYEKIVAQNPQFAVFSTMLDSVPQVAEKLKELNISYVLDQATFEDHPLGRVEWVKLYGALFDKEAEAKKVFDEQLAYVESATATEPTGKTGVMFYVTSKGLIYTRNGGDYMAKMLELSGGEYILSHVNPEKTGTFNMDNEQFYKEAKDADYIVYIWNIGGKPETLADFIEINSTFADFKAVKEGNVWCTTPDFFQISSSLGYMIKDLNTMFTLTDPTQDELTYLFKLK